MSLVMIRRPEQAVWIGNSRIVVTHVERDRVTLAINAPDDVLIVREELLPKGPPTANGHKGRLPREH